NPPPGPGQRARSASGSGARHDSEELHVLVDNSSAHTRSALQPPLLEHAKIRLHYAPTTASWLDQVQELVCTLLSSQVQRSETLTRLQIRKCLAGLLGRHEASDFPLVWTKAQGIRPPGLHSFQHSGSGITCPG